MPEDKLLASVELGVRQTSSEFAFNQRVITDEFLLRSLVSSGSSFGIVDTDNPALVTNTANTRPFHIQPSDTDALTIDVNSGVIFFPSGHFVKLTEKQSGVAMATLTVKETNIIFAEYRTIPSSDKRLSRYDALLSVRNEKQKDEDVIQVATLTDFNDINIFTIDRLKDVVVVGVITIITGSTSQKELSIDMSNTTFSFNRPWFSIQDAKHRAQKGTGSSSVPHSLSLNDLSSGDLTLYQQLLKHGQIVSKDIVKSNIPGSLECVDTISRSSWKLDRDGSLVSGSKYGKAGSLYAVLGDFPTRLVSVIDSGDSTVSFAGEVVPNTNLFVLAPDDDISVPDNIEIKYVVTKAAKANTVAVNGVVTYAEPVSGELIISNGISFNTLSQTTLSFINSGPIPQVFDVFIDDKKSFIVSPQVILTQTTLNTIGLSIDFNLTTTQFSLAKITIGMTQAVQGSTLDVQIKIKGTDKDDAVQEETLTFNSTWEDVSLPGDFNQNQFKTTTSLFKTVTAINVDSRNNDGANTEIVVYAKLEGITGDRKFDELCPVSKIFWDGKNIKNIQDFRPIQNNLTSSGRVPRLGLESELALPIFNSESVIIEDFRYPLFQDSEFSTLPRYSEGINLSVPALSDTSSIQEKYRSRAIGLSAKSSKIQELVVILHRANVDIPIDSKSVRARFGGVGTASTGTINVVQSSFLLDGETFTINDGFKSKVFEFDRNGSVLSGNVKVDINTLVTEQDIRNACITAINSSSLFINATPHSSLIDVVILTNFHKSSLGNTTSSETIADTNFSVSDMTGGISKTWQSWEILSQHNTEDYIFSHDFVEDVGKFQVEVFGKVVGSSFFLKSRFKPFLISEGGGSSGGTTGTFIYEETLVADGVATNFILPNGQTYVVGNSSIVLFINGLKAFLGDDYTEVDLGSGVGNSINTAGGTLPAGTKITFRLTSLLPIPVYDTVDTTTANGSNTLFTLPDSRSYVVGSNELSVYVNGAKKIEGAGDDYQEQDSGDGTGTQILFNVAPVTNAKINYRIEN